MKSTGIVPLAALSVALLVACAEQENAAPVTADPAAERALEDAGRTLDRAGDAAERGLEDANRAAERAGETVRREAGEAIDADRAPAPDDTRAHDAQPPPRP